jgi:PAS domain S-box-containing protein
MASWLKWSQDYTLPLGFAVCAVSIRAILDPFLTGGPNLVIALAAVSLAGAILGFTAAVVTAILTGLALELGFASNDFLAWPPLSHEQVHFLLFLPACAAVLWAIAKLKSSVSVAALAEARLKEVLRQIPAAVALLEAPNGKLLLSSRQSPSILGHPDHNFMSTDALQEYHGYHADGRRYLPSDYPIARALLYGEIVSGEAIRYHRPDGHAVDLEVHAGPVRDGNGVIIAAVGMAFDVTSKVQAERRLRDSELRYRLLSERLNAALDAGALGTWHTDLRTGRTEWDGAMASMLGLPGAPLELTNEESESFFDPESRANAANAFNMAIETGGIYATELSATSPDGGARWFAVRGSIVKEAGKGVGVIQDITDRKKQEDALRNLADMRALLMQEADHRIKNSLQLVVSLLNLQAGRIADPEAKDALKAAMGRVNAVADGHLALQYSADFTTVDATAMIEALCGRLATLNPAAAVDCAVTGPIMLEARTAILLELVLSEILTNALRHAFPSGTPGNVRVGTSYIGDRLTVTITDDGIGMPTQNARPGLGATIIQSLAGQIGAELKTESASGKGTAITIAMPIDPPSRA